MRLVYGDESMDEANERVCTCATVYGSKDQWRALESKWSARIGNAPFHTNDCDSDHGDYADTPQEENRALYKGLISLLAESELRGFGSSVLQTVH
jgi:hypothetical protein